MFANKSNCSYRFYSYHYYFWTRQSPCSLAHLFVHKRILSKEKHASLYQWPLLFILISNTVSHIRHLYAIQFINRSNIFESDINLWNITTKTHTLSGLLVSIACRNHGIAIAQQQIALQMISSGTWLEGSASWRTMWNRLSHRPQLFRSWQLKWITKNQLMK